MANLNKVMLIGNLTRDPELKHTPKGTAVASLSLAINRSFTPAGGEKREEVTFVDVEFWGRQAEIVSEYGRKGRPLYVEGRLAVDTWDDKQTGQKRSKMKVVGEMLQLLGSREGGGGGGQGDDRPARSSGGRSAAPARHAAPASSQDEGDDIPF